MTLTHEQKQSIAVQVERDISWKAYKEFIKQQIDEKKNALQSCSGDIMKFLYREQLLGQILLLEKQLEDFHNHVVNVINNQTE
jgi:hypothetical protein